MKYKNILELLRFVRGCLQYILLVAFSGLSIRSVGLPRIYGFVSVRGYNGVINMGRCVRFLGDSRIVFDDQSTRGRLIIGSNVVLEHNSTISPRGGCINLGDGSFIGPNVLLQAYVGGNISVGRNVMFAKDVSVFASNHDIANPENGYAGEIGRDIAIEDGVWVGAGAKVLAGVTIGEMSVIAAGSVITKNVRPYTLVAGVPARELKKYDHIQGEWINVA